MQLEGEQDSLPFVGQLTGIVLPPNKCIHMDSEDFTSAFNLFGKALPSTDEMTVIYLDNFDELRMIRTFGEAVEAAPMSEARRKFDELGLTRNSAKQLIMSLTGGIQGGELNGETGILKVAPEKVLGFNVGIRGLERVLGPAMGRKGCLCGSFQKAILLLLGKVFGPGGDSSNTRRVG